MASENQNQSEKEGRSSVQKMVFALVSGAVLVTALIYFFRVSFSQPQQETQEQTTQESFQGPAELSTAVQTTCQESAEKISSLSDCASKENEFLSQIQNCLTAYIAVEDPRPTFEGNYGDFSLQIAECYQKNQKSTKAIDFLQKIVGQYSWDVYMGPVSCDSESTLAAYIEKYTELRNQFKCIKKEGLNEIVQEIKNKNFSFLKNLIEPNQIIYHGILESDVNCPVSYASLKNQFAQVAAQNFEVAASNSQSTDENVFIELTRQQTQILNFQFRANKDGCLAFEALLSPSQQAE